MTPLIGQTVVFTSRNPKCMSPHQMGPWGQKKPAREAWKRKPSFETLTCLVSSIRIPHQHWVEFWARLSTNQCTRISIYKKFGHLCFKLQCFPSFWCPHLQNLLYLASKNRKERPFQCFRENKNAGSRIRSVRLKFSRANIVYDYIASTVDDYIAANSWVHSWQAIWLYSCQAI